MANQSNRSQPASLQRDEGAEFESIGALRHVARQPILDRMGRVHGYELLFRDSSQAFLQEDREQSTRAIIDHALVVGFDHLTSGQPAFVRCSAESLTEGLVDVLPPGMTILHLQEDVQPTKDLVSICQMLKSSGFRLALGSNCWEPGFEPLVDLADYIKIDFSLLGDAGRKYMHHRAVGVAAAQVAENVETQLDFRKACDDGFNYFQGFFFCHPETLKNRKVPANRLSQIKIMEQLHKEPVDLHELSKQVERDAALTYRLLRLVNSPINAIRQEVRSIESALMVVGEEMFRRMATLAVASELNSGQTAEVLRMAFVRARFCEIAASRCGLDATEQYLLGLLSLLPAMLRLPMDDLLPSLPLRDAIRQALEGHAIPERRRLNWIECQEHGDWAACDEIAQSHHMNRDRLVYDYAKAMVWAEAVLHSIR